MEDERFGLCVQTHASASVLCTLCPLMLSCGNPERHESIKALPFQAQQVAETIVYFPTVTFMVPHPLGLYHTVADKPARDVVCRGSDDDGA